MKYFACYLLIAIWQPKREQAYVKICGKNNFQIEASLNYQPIWLPKIFFWIKAAPFIGAGMVYQPLGLQYSLKYKIDCVDLNFIGRRGDHKTKTPYINLSRKLKFKRVKSHNMNIFKILTKNHYQIFHYGFRQNLFCFPFTLTAVLPIDQLWTISKALLKWACKVASIFY